MLRPCTVSGTVEQPTGDVANGPVVFTPERFVDIDDKVIVASVPVEVDLDPATGAFSVALVYSHRVTGDVYPSTYPNTYPGAVVSTPAHYHVSEPFGDDYCIQLDSSLNGSVLLADAPRC